jgi:hypothetical protein
MLNFVYCTSLEEMLYKSNCYSVLVVNWNSIGNIFTFAASKNIAYAGRYSGRITRNSRCGQA